MEKYTLLVVVLSRGLIILLKSDGWIASYEKVGNSKLSPPIASDSGTENFDIESFKSRYIRGYRWRDLRFK